MRARGLEEETVLIPNEPGTHTCSVPLCQSYLGGGNTYPIERKHSTPNIKHSGVIKNGDLMPGEAVSTDQYEYRVKGRLPHTRGKDYPHKILCV